MKDQRISREEFLMQAARLCSKRSTCNTQVGAVLAREGRVVSHAYNGSAPGQEHCIDVGCLKDDQGRCVRTIHAEINAILWAARDGISTKGTILYCTTAPCPVCSKLLTNSGITKVVYDKLYHDQRTTEESTLILTKCGIEVVKYDGE